MFQTRMLLKQLSPHPWGESHKKDGGARVVVVELPRLIITISRESKQPKKLFYTDLSFDNS